MKRKILYGIGAMLLIIACILPFIRADNEVTFDTMEKGVERIASKHASDFKVEDKLFIRKVYELNASDYEDMLCYGATSAMEVDELCVARYKNDVQKQRIIAKFQQRIDSQYKSFSGYAPRQADILKKAVILEKRDYVILLIHKDSESFKERISALF